MLSGEQQPPFFHSHVSHFSQTKAKQTKKESAFCLQPQGSHLFFSPDMCFTNNYWRMATASNFSFWKAVSLVLGLPTAHKNDVNTGTEQFGFYLQVHLRLCASHLNHCQFISLSTDLLWNASKLTPVFGRGGKVSCTPWLVRFYSWILRHTDDSRASWVSDFLDLFSKSIFTLELWFSQAPTVTTAFKWLLLNRVSGKTTPPPQSIYPVCPRRNSFFFPQGLFFKAT